ARFCLKPDSVGPTAAGADRTGEIAGRTGLGWGRTGPEVSRAGTGRGGLLERGRSSSDQRRAVDQGRVAHQGPPRTDPGRCAIGRAPDRQTRRTAQTPWGTQPRGAVPAQRPARIRQRRSAAPTSRRAPVYGYGNACTTRRLR